MAIVLKRREVQPVALPIPVEDELSQRQIDALEAVGLAPAPKVVIKKKLTGIASGGRVRITNTMFFWIKSYKPGDVGAVRRQWPAPDTPFSSRPRDDIYEIELDEPRVEGQSHVLFGLWELEPLGS